MESIKTGEPKGYDAAQAQRPKSDAEIRAEQLSIALAEKTEENERLKRRVDELEARLNQYEGNSRSKKDLAEAKMLDAVVESVMK